MSRYWPLCKTRRLASFGLRKRGRVDIENYSIGRKTYEIIVDGTMIALRDEEPKKIEVGRADGLV